MSGSNPLGPGKISGPLRKSKVAKQSRAEASYRDNVIAAGLNRIGPVEGESKHSNHLTDSSSTSSDYAGKHRASGSHSGESFPTTERYLGNVSTGGAHRTTVEGGKHRAGEANYQPKHRADPSPSFGSSELSPVPGVGREKAARTSSWSGRVSNFFGSLLS